jgi:MFS family permease
VTVPSAAPEPIADDQLAMGASTLAFGMALGVGTVTLPLLALAAGYDPAIIGLLTASSAVSQLGIRLVLPWILGRYPDRLLVAIACLMIAGSYATLLLSVSIPAFLVAQSLQGTARGLFWTGSQTHVVRGQHGAVKSLARNQVVGNLGTMSGPALAGALAAISLPLAVQAGVAIGTVAFVATLGLHHLPPFVRRPAEHRGRLWRKPNVLVGCLANFTAGGWRSMLGSYVPVVLSAGGLGPGIVGILVALADAASMAAAAVLATVTARRITTALALAVLGISAALAVLPFAAGQPVVSGLMLLIGGVGSGIIVVLGPALVSETVDPSDRGEALALSGTFRAVALLATPAGVALALGVLPLSAAMVVAGVLIGVPPLLIGRRATV